MSNKEQCVALLDDFTEAQLANVAAMLNTMKQAIADALEDEPPNAATIAAMEELENGGGDVWTGGTEELFAIAVLFSRLIPIKERDDLPAGAGLPRREGGCAGAAGDVPACGPLDGLGVELAALYVAEG